ncbi:MAG: phosphomannomutase/phosphoglucomutase [Spirochaetota bacterium]
MGIFKAYDIRGIYNKDFDREVVYRIGYFLPGLLKADRVLVGCDARLSSPEIFEYLSRGINDSGADVYSVGYATTPMIYFLTVSHNFDASVQITASHNPKEYNGLKISRRAALPVGYETGLAQLEKLVLEGTMADTIAPGKIIKFDARKEYIDFLKKYALDTGSLSIGIDCSNGMASILIKDILGSRPVYICDTLDGSFPNHEPNPLEEKNLTDLKKLVSREHLDLGIIYDGDADRVMFVDEKSRFISPDLIIAVLGHYYLKKEKGYVIHDIRTSKAVSEYIKKLGGTPYMWKVGHAFAKLKMRELNAIYGGELAGHYYLRDFFNCDSGILASLILLQVMVELKKAGSTLSALIDSIAKYAYSGEINFRIEKNQAAMEALKAHFSANEMPGAVHDFDGYRLEFKNWWFNVRPSNTEPYLRLVIEARDPDMLEEKLAAARDILVDFAL